MQYRIDAWVDRFDPVIRILDAATGMAVSVIQGDAVPAMMEQCGLKTQDLLDPCPRCQNRNACLLCRAEDCLSGPDFETVMETYVLGNRGPADITRFFLTTICE